LKKRDTLGSVNFDSVVISDFDESLKSVTTSLLYTDISPKEKYFITLNQWFDESLLKETNLQPLYFPSTNKDNYDEFSNEYFEKYNQYPNQLSFLSYDLVGLLYYLILQNNSVVNKKMFTKKNLFKGKVGIFEIKNNKINHILNFYKVEDGEFKKVF
ncbi:penicillin-binding protein activator, partial [Candidatus Pelagibacter sp.]|nr:penicillin-binding protein activator [Candidatus Pelagibacter sp.]